MRSVAQDINPPFVAVIMLDLLESSADEGPSPSDEMISIAPVQEGFLGLETTRNDQGQWVSVSYWRDDKCVAGWRKSGIGRVNQLFDCLSLENSCKFQSSQINDQKRLSKPLIAEQPAVPSPIVKTQLKSFGSKILNNFPTIAGLLGYEYARQS